MIQLPLPSTIGAQPPHGTILTTKTTVRKNQENDGPTGSRAWTSPCLRTTHSTKRSNVVSGKLFCRKIGPRICFADLLGFPRRFGGGVVPPFRPQTTDTIRNNEIRVVLYLPPKGGMAVYPRL